MVTALVEEAEALAELAAMLQEVLPVMAVRQQLTVFQEQLQIILLVAVAELILELVEPRALEEAAMVLEVQAQLGQVAQMVLEEELADIQITGLVDLELMAL
jgi:hypothetical protein